MKDVLTLGEQTFAYFFLLKKFHFWTQLPNYKDPDENFSLFQVDALFALLLLYLLWFIGPLDWCSIIMSFLVTSS